MFFKTKFALKYKVLEIIIALSFFDSIIYSKYILSLTAFIFFVWVSYENPFNEDPFNED